MHANLITFFTSKTRKHNHPTNITKTYNNQIKSMLQNTKPSRIILRKLNLIWFKQLYQHIMNWSRFNKETKTIITDFRTQAIEKDPRDWIKQQNPWG